MIKVLDFSDIKTVYDKRMRYDFPTAELKPLSVIKKARDRGFYTCLGYYESEELLAYAFLVENTNKQFSACLLDYFAVREDIRHTGVGSDFLTELKNVALRYDLFIIEVEDPAKAENKSQEEIRYKRYSFYLKNGIADSGAFGQVWGVDYKILFTGKMINPTVYDIRKAYFMVYRTMLSRFLVWSRIKFWFIESRE